MSRIGCSRVVIALLLLWTSGAWAQGSGLEERAYHLGAAAAQAAQSDPANAEALIAARYREALALMPDDSARPRVRAAFQRGYQDAVARREGLQVSTAPATARISDITPAKDVAWGQPVGAGQVFSPDTNPIYVWLRHAGLPAGTTITSVWYYLGTASPTRFGEGSVNVTPPSDWGQFNFELASGKQWPVGEYRVEILVMGTPMGEARFRVERSSPRAVEAPPAADRGLTGRWTIEYGVWGGLRPHTLDLRQEGSRVTGRLRTPGGNSVRADGTLSGGALVLNFIYDDVAALAEFMPREVAQQVIGVRSQAEMTAGGGDPDRLTGALSVFSLAWSGTPPRVDRRWEGGTAAAKSANSPRPIVMRREGGAPAPVVTTAPPPTGGTAPASRPEGAQWYVHPALGFRLLPPPGWSLNDRTPNAALQMRPGTGEALIQVASSETQGQLDPAAFAATWEASTLGPGSPLRAKRGGRQLTVDGAPAYEGVYAGDGVLAKVVFLGKPNRIFLLTGAFRAEEFTRRAQEFDRVVESFQAQPAGTGVAPLGELLEGIGKILQGLGQ